MIEHYKDDKSTVFSIVPFEVFEFKPGLYPGSFRVPACKDDSKPSRFVVGASEHLMTIGGKKEPIRIITPSYQIANSIVKDFLDGQLWTVPGEAQPGIAWVQGEVEVKKFLDMDLYETIRSMQRSWFVSLCKHTDDEWVKKKHHRVVSDQARFAAKYLGLEPEWMRAEEIGFTYNKCPACSTMNDPNNIICSGCRYILIKERFKKEDFAA